MYRIGELAHVSGVSKRTIDYYTHLGILNPQRSESNYRYYGEECLKILDLVEQYKKRNFPLNEIKERVEIYKTEKFEETKVMKHVQQLSDIMNDLESEIREIRPMLENLDKHQQKQLTERISPKSVALARTLMMMFG